MTTPITRAGKGSALTWDEMDSNFTDLNTEADAAQTTANTAVTNAATAQTDIDNHKADASNAHAASAISYTAQGAMQGATVQAGMEDIIDMVGEYQPTRRNRLINGAMLVDERNYGSAVTSGFARDRWNWEYAGAGTVSLQGLSATPPTGFYHYLRVTVTGVDSSLAAGDTYLISQRVEGIHWWDAAWGSASAKACTLSFRVRSSVTGTYGGSISAAAGGLSYPFSYTIDAANTWETKTVTIAGPTTGTWTALTNTILILRFGLGSGTTFSATAGAWGAGNYVQPTGTYNFMANNGATFDLTGVQLELGSIATPFEHVPMDEEIRRCRRYYARYDDAKMAGVATGATTAARVGMILPVKMRIAPSASMAGTMWVYDASSGYAVTTYNTWYTNTDMIEVDVTCSGAGMTAGRMAVSYQNGVGGHALKLDAECT